ncbi:hypothetical protein [Mycolicibacterium llatzerense]|uniref:hypothetical protein n=1 Tax=Mycolicibacterium llatzerense TaxID=280871 RepID=UPI0021B4DA1B|nr:hypothetical protein [Mycolicibacterium llatzerense]MCT7363994.1 hypothetical protein [Mycolicibacterium llatzerense]
MTIGEDQPIAADSTLRVRDAFYPDEFDYALAPIAHTMTSDDARIHQSLFEIQEALMALPPAGAPMHVLHREIEPWRRFDDPSVDTDAVLEFALGFGEAGHRNGRFMTLAGGPAPVATLTEAHVDLLHALRESPDRAGWVSIICRPRPRWTPPVGGTDAVAAVRGHMLAATNGDVASLRRGATGPLLDAMARLTDAELTDAVREAYDTAPTVLVLARSNGRPGHHHVLTNSALHFDVDDSAGSWLIRQVRLMGRTDQFGTLLGCWRPLLTENEDSSESASLRV